MAGFLSFAKAFLFCLLIILLGVDPIRSFSDSLDINHSSGFIVIEGMLPLIGFAVLASRCLQSRRELYWFIGGLAVFTLLPAWLEIAVGFTLAWGAYGYWESSSRA